MSHQLAVDDPIRLAKINLRMAGTMAQRHEHLARTPHLHRHVLADDGLAAREPTLVAQPLKDPRYRMMLLAVHAAIIKQYLVDEIRMPLKLAAERPPLAPVWRGLWKHQHLIDRLPVNPKIPRRRPAAHLVHQNSATDFLIKFHSLHPLPSRKHEGLSGLAPF